MQFLFEVSTIPFEIIANRFEVDTIPFWSACIPCTFLFEVNTIPFQVNAIPFGINVGFVWWRLCRLPTGIARISKGIARISQGIVLNSKGIVSTSKWFIRISKRNCQDFQRIVRIRKGIARISKGTVWISKGIVGSGWGGADRKQIWARDLKNQKIVTKSMSTLDVSTLFYENKLLRNRRLLSTFQLFLKLKKTITKQTLITHTFVVSTFQQITKKP